jgi:uncharacterized protein YkwD
MKLTALGALLTLSLTGVACTAPPGPGAPLAVVGEPVSTPQIEEMARELFEQVNQRRQSVGLQPLLWDSTLAALATQHSEAMAAGLVPFGHDGFEGRIASAGSTLSISRASENVATNNFPVDQVVAQTLSGWISSPGHRENLEGPYELSGVGIARSSRGEYFVAQIYIAR